MIGVYLRTARYYRPSQIAARLRFSFEAALRKRVPRLALHRYDAPANLRRDERAVFFPVHDEVYNHDLTRWAENAARLQKGMFRFLNTESIIGFPVNWNPSGTSRLWRYNLHYFEYALDLALAAKWGNHSASAELLGNILTDWIQANPLGRGVGWHSYPCARRIVNWIQALSLHSPENIFHDGEAQSLVLASLYQQARYLEDHLEVDVLGNHLLANGKAMVFAGLFFGGEAGERWFNIGRQILWRGLQNQIHEDGGHQERSPMYHALVLQDYLEVLLALQLNGKDIPVSVRERLILMTDFLDGIRHPDGEIPLFADAAFGIAREPDDILAVAESLLDMPGRWPDAKTGTYCALLAPRPSGKQPATSSTHPASGLWSSTGYVKLTGATSGDAMIIDTKALGPPHLPAHGHCSLFSYELSINGQRVIVDSGVEEYEPGPWRSFWRSTRAHNTVVVDNAEQSEIWGSFRAGARVRLLESAYRRTDGSSIFIGTHAGFAGQKTPTPHRRIIVALPENFWIVFDEITGTGVHAVESLVHLAPAAQCIINESSATVLLNGIELALYPWAAASGHQARMTSVRGSLNPIQGWYAAEFGKREPNTVLSFASDAKLPVRLGYLIAPTQLPVKSWNIETNTSGRETKVNITIRGAFEVRNYSLTVPR